MSCFFPTRGALSPLSSLCPFAFKVSALRCRSLSWPCDFIPSTPKLSECSKWYTTCLDGMLRRSAEGFAPALSTPMSLPLESLCLLSSLAGRCYRSCFSSAGGARSCGSGTLPPVLGFKDVHQPRGGGERAEPQFHLPHGLVPASSSTIWGKRMITSRSFTSHMGWSRPDRKHRLSPCSQLQGLDGRVLTPVGGRRRGPLHHGAHAEVVATAGEAAWRRGGHRRW
jgi:hypothetical protein